MMNRIRSITAGLRSRMHRRAAVLMYHRIARDETDPWSMCVAPERFAEQMEVLRANHRCVPLSRLTADRAGVPDTAIAVTFDDGYADNVHAALPVLERVGVPATFFVIGDAIDSRRELWWDALERIVLRPGRLPEVIVLRTAREQRSFHFGSDADYDTEEFEQRRDWKATEPPPGRRQAVLNALWSWLVTFAPAERSELIDQLAAAANAPRDARPGHRTLSTDDLLRLAHSPAAEVGAHTTSHVALTRVRVADARREVVGGRTVLMERTGRVPESFSFPHGLHDRATIALVREAGFARACTTVARPFRIGSDRHRIPRLAVPDLDGDAFQDWLRTSLQS